MYETNPTSEDYRAADELLELREDLPVEQRAARREHYAKRHRQWGDHKFCVRYGLKPPSTPEEEVERDVISGRLSCEDGRKAFEALANRPVDERMLAEHLAYIESQLFAYGEFLQAIIRCSQAWQRSDSRWGNDERAMADIIPLMNAGPPLYVEQVENLRLFLEEVRVKKALGEALHKQHTAETASMLARMAVDECVLLWQHCCDVEGCRPGRGELASLVTASRRFVRDHLPRLPFPKCLFAMVRHEHAAAREVLHEQAAAQVDSLRTYEKIVVNANKAEVTTDSVLIRTGDPANAEVSSIAANVFQQRGKGWIVRFAGGRENFLADSVGAKYLHSLLSRPDAEISSLDLARLVNKNFDACLPEEPEELLDRDAFDAYRVRYRKLEDELTLARELHDSLKEEEVREEMQVLGSEIKKAGGLGGKVRMLADQAERARKSVGNAIARAIDDIAKFDERLAEHLNGPALSRGLTPRYSPGNGVRWET